MVKSVTGLLGFRSVFISQLLISCNRAWWWLREVIAYYHLDQFSVLPMQCEFPIDLFLVEVLLAIIVWCVILFMMTFCMSNLSCSWYASGICSGSDAWYLFKSVTVMQNSCKSSFVISMRHSHMPQYLLKCNS